MIIFDEVLRVTRDSSPVCYEICFFCAFDFARRTKQNTLWGTHGNYFKVFSCLVEQPASRKKLKHNLRNFRTSHKARHKHWIFQFISDLKLSEEIVELRGDFSNRNLLYVFLLNLSFYKVFVFLRLMLTFFSVERKREKQF